MNETSYADTLFRYGGASENTLRVEYVFHYM